MLNEVVLISKIALSAVVVLATITIVNFLKTIYTSLVIPIIEIVMPVLKTVIQLLLDFITDTIPIAVNAVINGLRYLKSKVYGIISNYSKKNENEVVAEQQIYILNDNNELLCTKSTSKLDSKTIPYGLVMNKELHHDQDLIKEVLNKLKKQGIVHEFN